jgi:hypothetical protein
MDWFLTPAAEGPRHGGRAALDVAAPAAVPGAAPAAVPGAAPTGVPGPGRPDGLGAPGPDPRRLDLAIARVIDQQAESVLAGVRVAALHETADPLSYGAVLPGGSPTWLAADLDLLVQLVRLAAAAGVVLPHGVSGSPSADLADPDAQLEAARAGYRDVIDVLGRMSVADEVAPTCRDDALRLLRQVERRVHHLDEGHPALVDRRRPGHHGHHAYERQSEYIPGELLG